MAEALPLEVIGRTTPPTPALKMDDILKSAADTANAISKSTSDVAASAKATLEAKETQQALQAAEAAKDGTLKFITNEAERAKSLRRRPRRPRRRPLQRLTLQPRPPSRL